MRTAKHLTAEHLTVEHLTAEHEPTYIEDDFDEMALLNSAWPLTPEQFADKMAALDRVWEQQLAAMEAEDEDADEPDLGLDPYVELGLSRDMFR
jgi:hypothetical protein